MWEPRFTFHGFRYVELVDYPGPVSRDTVTGVVLHSDMRPTGAFKCSDPLLNQLQRNIVWGQRGNFVDIPTDCPQRDERLGWTGDIQGFAPTAAFNYDVAGFLTKWMQDLVDSQGADGRIPPVAPNKTGLPMTDGGPAWADALIIVPWTLYQLYGDTRILSQHYNAMRRFMDFVLRESPGYIRCAPEYEGWPGFGDWLSINAPTPRDLVGTAFLAYDAQLMAQIAGTLGKKGDAARYRRLWREAKAAFAARFLKGSAVTRESDMPSAARQQMEWADAISNGNLKLIDYGPTESEVFNTALFAPTQTAYVLALKFDLLPRKLRPAAVSELVADLERRDMHLSTGFVGTPYLASVLSENGRLDAAYALLHQRAWPGWLYPVTQGATTIWERWDGWTDESGFQDAGMNSFNHYAYGAIGAWLYGEVAGIQSDPSGPGYKRIILRPQPGGGLTSARGELLTLYGRVVSDWRLSDGGFEWRIVVPPNTTSTLHPPFDAAEVTLDGRAVPAGRLEVGAGEHLVIVSNIFTPHT